ncbi:MAG: hypothetical protein P1V81_03865 [Planctomycetota bacterium]|nr:hypothetical protein [Planctomycetota bacterium]
MGAPPSDASGRPAWRRLAALGLKLSASTVVALLLAELGLRWLAPQGLVTENFRYEALPGGEESGPGYRLQPLLFLPGPLGGRINSLGLRGPEFGPKGDGQRVLVLGDSFVYGAGVAEHEALPARLAAATPKLEFLNAGTPGYGTARELAWLETFGPELEPDRLLLCVFVGNDLTDNLDPRAPRIVDGRLFFGDASEADPVTDHLRIWRNASHLWRLWERKRLPAPKQAGDGPAQARGPDDAERSAGIARLHAQFAQKEAGRIEIYLPSDGPDSEELRRMATAYDVTRLALEGIVAWCVEHGVELGVVLIPDVVQVDARLRSQVLAQAGLAEDALDWRRPQRSLAAWCEELGLPCLDLAPAMGTRQEQLRAAGEATDMGLYLFGDSHWSAAGHAFAAELVTDFFARD